MKRALRWLCAIAMAVLLGACGTTAKQTGGGYYLDDGPPEGAPSSFEDVPDAQPKQEPLRSSTLKPYTALGMRFVPMTRLEPYRAQGRASWYGRRYHGRVTASGEAYDMLAMTAAHPILPIPSYARVTHLRNGRTVIVRVNDRGPFHSERVIDLSYAAAAKLDLVREGSAQVEVELIIPAQYSVSAIPKGIRLQLGAFQTMDNALSSVSRLKSTAPWLADQLSIRSENGLHKVIAGPYATPEEAKVIADRIERTVAIQPILSQSPDP